MGCSGRPRRAALDVQQHDVDQGAPVPLGSAPTSRRRRRARRRRPGRSPRWECFRAAPRSWRLQQAPPLRESRISAAVARSTRRSLTAEIVSVRSVVHAAPSDFAWGDCVPTLVALRRRGSARGGNMAGGGAVAAATDARGRPAAERSRERERRPWTSSRRFARSWPYASSRTARPRTS